MRSFVSRRKNRSGYVGGLSKLFFPILLLAVAGEWGAGFALQHYNSSKSDQDLQKIYDTDNPGHYRDVIAEGLRANKKIYSPLVEYRMAPFSGEFFTIHSDGFRTIGRDQSLMDSGAKILVYGGSSVLGMGVANDETIPAYLDGALRAAGKSDIQVYNFGAQSWYSTQERIHLEKLLTSGFKPDLAVFVDGAEEFLSCDTPDSTAWSQKLAGATGAFGFWRFGGDWGGRSNLVGLVQQWRGRDGAGAERACRLDVDSVITRLDANRRIIEAMGDKMGFKTLFVTQPVAAFSYDQSKRPVPFKNFPVVQSEKVMRGYTRMAEMQAGGKLRGGNHLWLAELEPEMGNAYIDAFHYSPRMNQAIAGAVAKFIGDKGLLP